MFDWLKKALSTAPAPKVEPKPSALEDYYEFGDLVDKIAKQAFQHLYSRNRNLTPVYRDDVTSEEYADAHKSELPLVYFWNQQHTREGTKYSLTVNGYVIGLVLEEALRREDKLFGAVQDKLLSDIHAIVDGNYTEMTKAVNLSPKDFCEIANLAFDDDQAAKGSE